MQECECCKIIKGCSNGFHKIIVELEGGWVLNHYNHKDRNYLGRLALVPKNHRMDIGDLSQEEATTLVVNIQRINCTLRRYFNEFYEDLVERVYIIYFHETPFDYEADSAERRKKEHMHIHLLPRTKEMLGGKKPTDVAAWKIVCLLDMGCLPENYKIFDEQGKRIEAKVEHLMDYLKRSLSEDQP